MGEEWCIHRYRQDSTGSGMFDVRLYDGNNDCSMINDLLNAALGGDLTGVKSLHRSGVELASCDYDRRSAAHLAAAGGRINVLRYLKANGVDMTVKDRWGCTPIEDAKKLESA